MATWSLGSAATELFNLIPNIPTSISGTTLNNCVDRARLRIENYTGNTISSTGIEDKYQPALINLTAANVLRFIHLQGGDTSIGDVSLGKSALESAQFFETEGIAELRRLGMKTTLYKTYG